LTNLFPIFFFKDKESAYESQQWLNITCFMLQCMLGGGSHEFYTMVPPRMPCGIKHVTIVEINSWNLDVCVSLC